MMATERNVAVIVLLYGLNYAAWRVQCHIALIFDGLWRVVSETKLALGPV